MHEESKTLLRIVHDAANSKLKAKVLRDGHDITDACAASAFVWTRAGSAAGTGKEIAVSDAEVNGDVQFSCSYTETQGVYGTVSVDNELMVSHSPATADAEHVFTLGNGMLKVEIPDGAGKGAEYELVDGVLSVNTGFTGTITAEYAFTTAPTREIDFEYDHNGLRTQKKVIENGITTIYDYTLHGKLITHLTKRVVDWEGIESSEEMHFFYDAQSRPAFVEYEGEMYRYIHNLQGDIIGMVDAAGKTVVEYRYDAWGKPLSCKGDSADTIGVMNLLQYRGYSWDVELEMYCLRHRYYDPEMARFNNADIIIEAGQGINSSNVYCYCGNNPIRREDPTGTFWSKITGFINKVAEVVASAVNVVKECVCDIFGVASYIEYSKTIKEEKFIGFGYETGIITTQLVSGNDEKPIVFYQKATPDGMVWGVSIELRKGSVCYEFGRGEINLSVGYDDHAIDFGIGIEELSVGHSTSKQTNGNTTTLYSKVTANTKVVVVVVVVVATGSAGAYTLVPVKYLVSYA